jgi:hypothetical protein
MNEPRDFEYGDPLADAGTEGWAKRKREFDRLTVSAAEQGVRSDLTSGHGVPKSDAEVGRTKRLRAVNRASAVIQRLHDEDLLAVDVAAKFGPSNAEKRKEMDRRAKVLQERLESIRILQPDLLHRKVKRLMNEAARDILAIKPSLLEKAQRAARRLTGKDRKAFLGWVNGGMQ